MVVVVVVVEVEVEVESKERERRDGTIERVEASKEVQKPRGKIQDFMIPNFRKTQMTRTRDGSRADQRTPRLQRSLVYMVKAFVYRSCVPIPLKSLPCLCACNALQSGVCL